LILKVHMHCDACASKITKYLHSIKGTKSDLGFHLLLLLINLFFQTLEIEQQCLCFKVLKR
jgi:copper chaperone CopZ